MLGSTLRQSLAHLTLTALLTTHGTMAGAEEVTLDFEGFASFEGVLDYYDAGFGHLGSGPGPDWGVNIDTGASITAAALANLPSPSAAMGIDAQPGNQLIMNVADGFIGRLAFFYSSENIRSTVTVYEGPNGTGAELASAVMEPIFLVPSGEPSTVFDTWQPVNLAFTGTARSAVILMTDNLQPGGGMDSRRAYWLDNLTLDSLAVTSAPRAATPVPAMGPVALAVLCGLLLFTGLARTKRRG